MMVTINTANGSSAKIRSNNHRSKGNGTVVNGSNGTKMSPKQNVTNNNHKEVNNNNNNYAKKLKHPRHQHKLQFPECVAKEDVPMVMRKPGILTGYRPTDQPWSYYFRSLFRIHNETGNVWSHLLGPFVTLTFLYSFRNDLDFRSDASAHGLLLLGVTSTCTFLFSTMAHLLHNKSAFVHYVVYGFDYMGIAMYGYGFGFMTFYCSGNEAFYRALGGYFPVIHTVVAANVTFMNISTRIRYKNRICKERKILQVLSSTLSAVCCDLYLFFKLFSGDEIPLAHWLQIFFSLSNMVLYSLHQPERCFPGKFDIWGHGHQWFHLSVICGVLAQFYAGHRDLLTLDRAVLNMAQPDIFTIWASLAVFIVLNIGIIIFYSPKLKAITKSCD